MKYQSRDQLQNIAHVSAHPVMDRRQRLERWSKLLERDPNRSLAALAGTEYRPQRERDLMRSEDSPLSVAFEDPVLRGEGLQNDTYGEAKRFFEVSDEQLHEIVCYCHAGERMMASRAAYCVRTAIEGPIFLRVAKAFLGWGKAAYSWVVV
ncbi:hypothetical protein [Mesorhizobium koreense]|uniref:hypothetical protein n=1 Tax=Mesorhizobium koreense TaxID=3074855 RepID=UPI00287B7ECB|nr:hypothetical protein [Mesorhizobium sp. WR6]